MKVTLDIDDQDFWLLANRAERQGVKVADLLVGMDEFTTQVLATVIGMPIGAIVALALINFVLEPLADWFTRTSWRARRSYDIWRAQRRQHR